MIILRYISREILTATLVISGAVLLFSVGRRFAQYLDEAWRGDLSPDVLFIILAYRIPEFLTLILPVGFFLGMLLAFGRLYADSEMVVLSSCGVSKRRILIYSLLPAGIIAVIVGVLALFVSPHGLQQVQEIEDQQSRRSELEILSPQRFQRLSGGEVVAYFQRFADDRDAIEDVFIAEMAGEETDQPREPLFVLTAERGQDWRDPDTGQRYLLLRDGYQYVGRPGDPDYREVKFDTYGYHLPPREIDAGGRIRLENVPTTTLLETDHPAYKAELQWRLALPLMVIIVTLVAVPMSHTSPRKGRFVKMFPAFFMLMFYLGLLVVGKGWMEAGDTPVSLGLWWVHCLYLLIAVALLWWNNGQPRGRWFHQPHRQVRPEAADA